MTSFARTRPCAGAAWLICFALWACGGAVETQPVRWHVEETLFHPTAQSVDLMLTPAEACTVLVRHDTADGTEREMRQSAVAEQALVFKLEGLGAGRKHSYQVGVQRREGATPSWRPEQSFSTLATPGEDFSFAILADSHAYAQWAREQCGDYDLGWRTLQSSLGAVAADDTLSFAVLGTDSSMTRCGKGCLACEIDGEMTTPTSASSARDALLRYRKVFGPSIYGRIGADLPLLNMLGDHDGEWGWIAEKGACKQTADDRAWSRAARAAHVPDAHAVYGGDPEGTWYAVRAGDLLLVILDVAHETPRAPTAADIWSLGDAQWSWLETTLSESDATFKVVLAEHMLGGLRSPDGGRGSQCWKARSSLRATLDGELNSPFVGEQQRLHELMRDQGVQLFMNFHDHVVTMGEKPGVDGRSEGVAYVGGGQCADAASEDAGLPGPPWAHEPWYQQAMDYDADGVAEFFTDRTGTLEKGWFKVSVHGDERVDFDYLRASSDPQLDGTRVLGFQLLPDGPLLPTAR